MLAWSSLGTHVVNTLWGLSAWLAEWPMAIVKHSSTPRNISTSCLSSLTTLQSTGKPCAPTANLACMLLETIEHTIFVQTCHQWEAHHLLERYWRAGLANLPEPHACLLQGPRQQHGAKALPQLSPEILRHEQHMLDISICSKRHQGFGVDRSRYSLGASVVIQQQEVRTVPGPEHGSSQTLREAFYPLHR